MKDVITSYWFNYKMSTIEFGDRSKEEARKHILKSKFAIATIHDISPKYTDKVFQLADELEKLNIKFNFAVIPWYNKQQEYDIRKNSEFVKRILDYNQPVALHGLYHESDGRIEHFNDFSFDDSKKEFKKGLEMLFDAGINNINTFVPPTWSINKHTIEALTEVNLDIIETVEEILLMNKNLRLHSNLLNWDQGSKEAKRAFLKINKRIYKQKVLGNTQLIRFAIHPKDPDQALADQKEMIEGLKDINYNFLWYSDIERLFG
jgi:predicted deacetylase